MVQNQVLYQMFTDYELRYHYKVHSLDGKIVQEKKRVVDTGTIVDMLKMSIIPDYKMI